jgi:hypothetical protein
MVISEVEGNSVASIADIDPLLTPEGFEAYGLELLGELTELTYQSGAFPRWRLTPNYVFEAKSREYTLVLVISQVKHRGLFILNGPSEYLMLEFLYGNNPAVDKALDVLVSAVQNYHRKVRMVENIKKIRGFLDKPH